MTVAIVILSALDVLLLGVCIYLFVVWRRTERQIKIVLSSASEVQISAYVALVGDLGKKIEAQSAILDQNLAKFNQLRKAYEVMMVTPVVHRTPDEIAAELNKIFGEKP